jgi:hypothetical protein
LEETNDNRTTRAADDATESAVLTVLLELHPIQVTLEELAREVAGEEAEFAERDAIERAVRDLAGAGLLHRVEGRTFPTRAALRFNELLDRLG